MDAHRLGVDVRLERVVRVRQVGQFEGHLVGSFRLLRFCDGGYAPRSCPRSSTGSRRSRPRPLRPEVYELDGISRASVEAHYKLYEGYVAKRNEILGRLADVDLGAANQVVLRAPRAEGRPHASRSAGSRTTSSTSAISAEAAATPDGAFGDLVARHFGSADAWRADLKATGMAGRGWAWTAYDWDEGRLFNYVGDAQNTFPVWNATPLVALDVYEHAYFLDYQTDRASYIDAFFANLDWDVVNGWVEQYGIPS